MALFPETNQPLMQNAPHEVETIVGPSVKVEGDFNSQGNVLIQGIVSGNVRTDKYLQVEEGAKIMASVHADSAKISGEVQGNIKAKNTLELTATARVIGDIESKTLIVAPGAILHGKCAMLAGSEAAEMKKGGATKRRGEDLYSMPRSLEEMGA